MPTLVVHTIGTANDDYLTPASWEAATDDDLVSADEVREGRLTTSVLGSVTLNGSTTDATRFRRLTHNGVPYDHKSGTGTKLAGINVEAHTVKLEEANAEVVGLGLECDYTSSSSWYGCVEFSANNGLISGCTLIRKSSGSSSDVGQTLFAKSTTTGCVARNCLIVVDAPSGSSVYGVLAYAPDTIYNNVTIYESSNRSFYGSSSTTYTTIEVHSVIAMGGGLSDFQRNNIPASAFSNCLSSDNSASGFTSSYANESASSIFVDPDNGDFHLLTDGNAYGNGLDKSGSFTDDIEGYDRTTTDDGWSIGCYMHPLTITEHTVGNDGADDYTPAGWESATDVDCRAIHTRYVAKVNGVVTLASTLSINGSSTDADRYREVTFANSRYNPRTGTGDGFRCTAGQPLSFQDLYARATGILIERDQNVGPGHYTFTLGSAAAYALLDGCTIARGGGATAGGGILVSNTGQTTNSNVRNCILLGDGSDTVRYGFVDYSLDVITENVTIYGLGTVGPSGYIGSSQTYDARHKVRNLIAKNFNPNGATDFANCISEDSSAAGFTDSHGSIDPADLFRDAANNDFRLLPTAVARGAGVAIEDNERDIAGLGWNDPPSIGAYEIERGRASSGKVGRMMMR